MENFVLAEWFDLISLSLLASYFTFHILKKPLRESLFLNAFFLIVHFFLCCFIIPYFSAKLKITHLKESTDVDSLQYTAIVSITYFGWWILFLIVLVLFIFIHWKIKKRSPNHMLKETSNLAQTKSTGPPTTNRIQKLNQRVEKDLENKEIDKAISRYTGYLKFDPTSRSIHFNLANLYLLSGDRKKAGKHFYFKSAPNEIEKECIEAFCNSKGNDAILILKELISKENYKIKTLDHSTKLKLKELVDEATEQAGTTPNFLKGIKRHLDKIQYS